ncbi:1305_t:CDS:2 [Diversispora eburnea]|uniref:1305_t:CDS:1 n=1 Tax=Diversispora eburnea TaxID=1213867 RepID=A0A9N8YNS0_9GLOM|nr:1305_t:CDS:2 [Diversispora eburnea]
MLTYKQNNFNQNNQSNQISDRSIFQQTSQQKQTDWQQKTYNWNYQQIIMTEIQELSERLVNHKEIVKQISKYDKLIEIKEEGAEVKEFLESLTEEKRKELFPTVDEFLRNMQNQSSENIENEMAKEFRPGFEGRPLPKLIRMIESGKTFNLSKNIKRKLGTNDDRRINKQIRKYVESYRFQPSPMLDG